jgi:hypothetical protein
MLRVALIVAQLICLAVLIRWRQPFAMRRWMVLAAVVWGQWLSRLLGFLLLYEVVGLPPPIDVPAFYRPWADAAAAGGLPYADFNTPFSPLFPYLLAAIGSLGSDKAFVLFFLLCDMAAFAVWSWIAEVHFGRAALLGVAVLYGLNPEVVGAALAGQDESLSALLAGLGIGLVLAGRQGFAGAMSGILIVTTKFFVALYPIALFAARRVDRRFVVGLLAVAVPVLLAFAAAGIDVSYPLQYRGAPNERWSPGNIWFLAGLTGFDIDGHRGIATAILGASLVGATAFVYSRRATPDLATVGSVLFLTFSLVAFKSWYLTLAAPLLAIAVCRRYPWGWPVLAVVALHGAASLSASAWYEWARFGRLDLLWADSLPDAVHRGGLILFAALQIVEVTIKAVLLVAMLAWCRRDSAAPDRAPGMAPR